MPLGSQLLSRPLQFVACVGAVLAVASACLLGMDVLGYRVVALLLLLCVSILAMLFDMVPVLLAATVSAAVWNFFFIPPVYTFHIGKAEDVLMFLLYFVIALVNAVLTLKIRQAEKRASEKEQHERSIALYATLFNSLSHELRTPIAAIVGSVDTLQQRDARLTPAHRAELLDTIDEAGLRLDRQVKNLLNMQRSESGLLRPKPDWCDVNELVSNTLRDLRAGQDHVLRFAPDAALPLFKLDGGLLEQVVHNLVHNAITYTAEGAAIAVEVKYENGWCVIVVADGGPGFPEEEREKVFEKFYRLPNSARGGSGLGLSIVKGFVEALHGTVRLEANVPDGTRAIVRIPAETSFLSNLKHD